MRKKYHYITLFILVLLSTIYAAQPKNPAYTITSPEYTFNINNYKNIPGLKDIIQAFAKEAQYLRSKNPNIAIAFFMLYQNLFDTQSYKRCTLIYEKNKIDPKDPYPYEHFILRLCITIKKNKISNILCAYFTDPICPTCGWILRRLGYTQKILIHKKACNNKSIEQDLLQEFIPLFKESNSIKNLITKDIKQRITQEITEYTNNNNIVAFIGFGDLALKNFNYKEIVFVRDNKTIDIPRKAHLTIDAYLNLKALQKTIIVACFSHPICPECAHLLYNIMGCKTTNVNIRNNGCKNQKFPVEILKSLTTNTDTQAIATIQEEKQQNNPNNQSNKPIIRTDNNTDTQSITLQEEEKQQNNPNNQSNKPIIRTDNNTDTQSITLQEEEKQQNNPNNQSNKPIIRTDNNTDTQSITLQEEEKQQNISNNQSNKPIIRTDNNTDTQSIAFTQEEQQHLRKLLEMRKHIENGNLNMLKLTLKEQKQYITYEQKLILLEFAHTIKKTAMFKYLIQQINPLAPRETESLLWRLFVENKEYNLIQWIIKTKKIHITPTFYKKLRKNKEQDSTKAKETLKLLQNTKKTNYQKRKTKNKKTNFNHQT